MPGEARRRAVAGSTGGGATTHGGKRGRYKLNELLLSHTRAARLPSAEGIWKDAASLTRVFEMSPATIPFTQADFNQLISNGWLTCPQTLRAFVHNGFQEASLLDNGEVLMNGERYENLISARQALSPHPESSSSVWQYWSWYSEARGAWTPLEHLRARLDKNSEPASAARTSLTHPLRVDYIKLPQWRGRLGMTFCPGKCSDGLYGAPWQRDLVVDIEALEAEPVHTLITLMEEHEFALLKVPEFAAAMGNSRLEWWHLPVKDMNTPGKAFEELWAQYGEKLQALLQDGQAVVLHCRGGIGRTGMLAARILVEAGVTPAEAVATVRRVRAHTIETYAQEYYVLARQWQMGSR